MIGNDIVDLEVALNETNWKRRGYLDKLFSGKEQDLIFASKFADRKLWIFWAMKEATYKAHQRRFRLPRFYNPKYFTCEESTSVSGRVKAGNNYYYTTHTTAKEKYLHCISSVTKKPKIIKKVFEEPETVKPALLQEYSLLENLPKETRIMKDANFIPQLFCGKQLLPANFSISHHGRFSAFTLALMNY